MAKHYAVVADFNPSKLAIEMTKMSAEGYEVVQLFQEAKQPTADHGVTVYRYIAMMVREVENTA